MIKVVKIEDSYSIYNNDQWVIGYATAQQVLDYLNKTYPGFTVEWDITILPQLKYFNKNLQRLIKDRDLLNVKISLLTNSIISNCPHPVSEIVEAPYKDGAYDSVDSPFRLCKICGLAEEGWGCGYKILAPNNYNDLTHIDRDAANDLIRKFIFQGDIKKFGK